MLGLNSNGEGCTRLVCEVRVVGMCRAYLTESDIPSSFLQDFDPYDQYEVSVPMSIAGDCLGQVWLQTDMEPEFISLSPRIGT